LIQTRKAWPAFREVGRIVILCALIGLEYVAIQALPRIIVGFKGLDPWPNIEWQILAGLLVALVLVPVVVRSPWRDFVLFGLLAAIILYVGYLSNFIEAAIFIPSTRDSLLLGGMEGLLASLVTAALLIAVVDREAFGRGPDVEQARLTWRGWAWRLAACAVIYLAAYFVVGGIMYQAFMAPFYNDPSLSLAMPDPTAPIGQLLFPLQFVRGLLFTLAMLPLALGLRVKRAALALILAAILYTVGGLAPLLIPNPHLPAQLRFYHSVENLLQNGSLGVAIALLLGPNRIPARRGVGATPLQ
jgi:hypothetical protein